jgi:hypothetical protein
MYGNTRRASKQDLTRIRLLLDLGYIGCVVNHRPRYSEGLFPSAALSQLDVRKLVMAWLQAAIPSDRVVIPSNQDILGLLMTSSPLCEQL